jgi:hypothetical protein
MNPSRSGPPPGCGRLPRAGGDGPRRSTAAVDRTAAPPRRRGWTLLHDGSPEVLEAPAQAGWTLGGAGRGAAADAPPRRRGWTLRPVSTYAILSDSPAQAGMDRTHGRHEVPLPAPPRRRGWTQLRLRTRSGGTAPPRRRGWTLWPPTRGIGRLAPRAGGNGPFAIGPMGVRSSGRTSVVAAHGAAPASSACVCSVRRVYRVVSWTRECHPSSMIFNLLIILASPRGLEPCFRVRGRPTRPCVGSGAQLSSYGQATASGERAGTRRATPEDPRPALTLPCRDPRLLRPPLERRRRPAATRPPTPAGPSPSPAGSRTGDTCPPPLQRVPRHTSMTCGLDADALHVRRHRPAQVVHHPGRRGGPGGRRAAGRAGPSPC